MRQSTLASALGILALLALAQKASPDGDSGKQQKESLKEALKDVNEKSFDGIWMSRCEDGDKIIHGVVSITRPKNTDIYLFQWLLAGSHSQGFGLRLGDQISVHWWNEGVSDGKKVVLRGVTAYKIDGDKLVGRWVSLPGSGQQRRETLFFLKALPVLQDNE